MSLKATVVVSHGLSATAKLLFILYDYVLENYKNSENYWVKSILLVTVY